MASPSVASTDKRTAELRLSQACAWLICNNPFFATLVFKLDRVVDTSAKTMWTDGRRIGYNPAFVETLTRDELVGVLCHEVMHVAALHPWRKQARDHKAWNVACDQAINPIIKESGLVLPKGALEGQGDKSAEELYVHPPEDKQDGKGQGDGQDGNEQGEGDPGGCGEVRDATNEDGTAPTEAQREQQMQEAKIGVQQAINAAKRAGTLPAGLERFAEDLTEPKVNWREVLSRFLDGQAKSDYSWSRPNRRYASGGILFPSLHSPSYGKVAMGCDTSGSINQETLKDVCSEVLGALECYEEQGQEPELAVAWFDHAVYEQTVSDVADLKPQGGGGTSFRVVMDWVREREEAPKALIMVTDGQCNDWGEEPPCPVLWVLTERNRGFQPPFGELTCTLNEE